ncbi:MAG TPA: outer membrane beta-barrel protein [Chitinophagaceae bacterium]
MKPLRYLLLFLTLLPVTCIIGQDKPGDTKPAANQSSPFLKGKNGFTLRQNYRYSDMNTFDEDDNKIESNNSLRFNLDYKYFIADGFALGLDLKGNFSGNHVGNTDNLTRNWSVTPNVTYGKTFGNGFNLYLEGGVSFGAYKDITESPSGSTTDKSDLFGYEFTLGAPILLLGNSNTYLTPFFSYKNQTFDYEDGKETISGLNVGLRLETYLFCPEITCDKKMSISKDWYNKGDMFIGYTSTGSLEFGTNTTEYNMVPDEYKENFTDASFKAEFGYYLTDYFAIGAGFGFMSEMQKSDEFDTKYSQSSLSFMPMAQIHIPVENGFRNFFLQLEGKVGSQKAEYEFGSSSTTQEYSVSGWGANIGHNAFFTKHLSFTTLLGYQWRTNKDKESDVKESVKGFTLQGGVRFNF